VGVWVGFVSRSSTQSSLLLVEPLLVELQSLHVLGVAQLHLLVDRAEAREALEGVYAAAGALVAPAVHSLAAGAVLVARPAAHLARTLQLKSAHLHTFASHLRRGIFILFSGLPLLASSLLLRRPTFLNPARPRRRRRRRRRRRPRRPSASASTLFTGRVRTMNE
jgi:hypothetical protein